MLHNFMEAFLTQIIGRQFIIALRTLYWILTNYNVKTKGWFGSFLHHTTYLFYEAHFWQCVTLLNSMGVFLM